LHSLLLEDWGAFIGFGVRKGDGKGGVIEELVQWLLAGAREGYDITTSNPLYFGRAAVAWADMMYEPQRLERFREIELRRILG
jgi:hypothetical protein